jgi:hypothetical protein
MQARERDLCWIMVELANNDQRGRDTATQWRSEEGAGRSHGPPSCSYIEHFTP